MLFGLSLSHVACGVAALLLCYCVYRGLPGVQFLGLRNRVVSAKTVHGVFLGEMSSIWNIQFRFGCLRPLVINLLLILIALSSCDRLHILSNKYLLFNGFFRRIYYFLNYFNLN